MATFNSEYAEMADEMVFAPGDILRNITGIHPSAKRGQYVFHHAGLPCVLEDYLPDGSGNRPVVEKAVCVGAMNRGEKFTYHFRIRKYRPKVMEQLYRNGKLDASGNEVALKRWKNLAVTGQLPRIERYQPKDNHLKRFKAWRLVVADSWEMPIPASLYNDATADFNEAFCPIPLPYGCAAKFLSPCYSRVTSSFPQELSGVWKDSSGGSQQVKVFLHGFLDPQKLHFGIRKHVLACLGQPSQAKAAHANTLASKFAKAGIKPPQESDLWRRLLGDDLLGGHDCTLFDHCPERPEKAEAPNCPATCKKDQFTAVHRRIAPLLAAYCQEFVTILHDLATKSPTGEPIEVASETPCLNDGSRLRVTLHYQANEGARRKVVFGGVFYSGNGDKRSSAFHLTPLTMYFSDEPLYPHKDCFPVGTLQLTRT